MAIAFQTITLTVAVDTDRLPHAADQLALPIEAAAQGMSGLHSSGAITGFRIDGDGQTLVAASPGAAVWLHGPLAE